MTGSRQENYRLKLGRMNPTVMKPAAAHSGSFSMKPTLVRRSASPGKP